MYPTSLLPILFSLFLLHQRTHAECEPVTCGELPIKYPFWLGGPSYPSNSSCGHPAFELRCTGNSTSTTWALWNARNKALIEGKVFKQPADLVYKMIIFLQLWKPLGRRQDQGRTGTLIDSLRVQCNRLLVETRRNNT
ncbi:unnamed protein product [Triticum turgidum subsp. durum]|uniref:Wall-associated receptor kinase galacturonan-binding domain-containing protein n=1 Tax=Triticum turgidum subsp. durum TaxID=4567 RepID=A0A9R1Q838_TRITD|nr:unnamed protein product [Triticum turgidum subsp. durum]